MTRLPALALLAALIHTPCALASQPATPPARALMAQAQADAQAGKITAAVSGWRAAAEADPAASAPLSQLAAHYAAAARSDDSHRGYHARLQALAFVEQALQRDPKDEEADALRGSLSGRAEQAPYQTLPAAQAELEAGRRFDAEGNHAKAKLHYHQASRLDPRDGEILIAYGQCHAHDGHLPLAESAFRQATLVDPQYDLTWINLASNLFEQKKIDQAYSATLGALAALPSASETWMLVRGLRRIQGKQTDTFQYKPMGSYWRSQNRTIVEAGMPEPDARAWRHFALAQAEHMRQNKAPRSAFALELAAWEAALPQISAMADAALIKDATMLAMLRFHQAGQLKAALFLLAWRESYRPDFEAWKKANPDAIRRFVDTFHLAP